ncbi:hypothetical protein [Sphingopyxis macrogoltabida]|uniref:Uncharacterized protein n=1 Tax=Sphingopyxis macrogoltabida TaxID=33050 RepID=A0AAC9FGA1_SPHMC|nr:hypothetical protein [Sphingopyxis macrogoltabida]ALJ15027.1 hypothetical protein LH19_19315 [Sphingopyxis macrogoltabida]AMU91275.1 hypothetical protein ATM17_19865 [Sphingopyxis macrogoltabida]
MKFLSCTLFASAALMAAQAQAQDADPDEGLGYVAEYGATIGEPDRIDSDGAALTDPAAILAQDRFNVDVRGILQPGDSPDEYFADEAQREEIAGADIRFQDDRAAAELADGTPSLFVTVMRRPDDGRLVIFLATSDGEPADDPDSVDDSTPTA